MQNIRVLGWKPASLPSPKNPYTVTELGQNGTPSAFLSDPILSAGIDIVAATTTGYLAWESSKRNGDLLPLWIVFAVGMSVKALHDFSRIKW